MAFTGKATYTAGTDLPELVEDVSDIIGIVSPYETPLLDHLGDARRAAVGTVHEWVEDALLPNTDRINQAVFSPDATTATSITVDNGGRFRVGDQIRALASGEVMLVTAVAGDTLTVQRGYGGTVAEALADDLKLFIIGNAALEGADRPQARFTSRVRRSNYTQIFTAGVEVSGSMRAARAHGVADEVDYQKQMRIRELLRDLENTVINGVAPAASPQGSASVRRTMNGIISTIQTNVFEPSDGNLPDGGGPGSDELTETMLNTALRLMWEQSSATADTILVGGSQKRKINEFISSSRAYSARERRLSDMLSVYESDFGVARVVLSRWVPADTVIMLDSSRIEVLPLAGRSFHYKPLAATGDAESGQVIGEYTLEMTNENAHLLIRNLGV